MKLNRILLTSLVASPSLVLPLNLTGCSQTWGYLNPISIGSIDKNDENNPFYKFRSITFNDADGLNIVDCLQSNFIIDQAKSTMYAYSSPVTKWFQTKEEAEAEGRENPRPLNPKSEWQKLDDGWKTTSDNIVTSTTLKDEEHDNVNKTYTNNWNFNLISNINFTTSIASTLLAYLSYGLQYQASQFADEEDLNTAWGNESQLTEGMTLDTGSPTSGSCRDYYEYAFASSNSHGTGKTTAFLRPTAVNFNFETFPYPSYSVSSEDKMDVRQDISTETKQLLMGKNAESTTRFCDVGTDDLPAYYTDSKDITPVRLPYKDKTNDEWKWYENGLVKQYLYSCVPIVVKAKNMSATWVDPLKNDSFVPSDYFINDKTVVNNSIGDSWAKITDYAEGGTESTRQSFTFDIDKETKNQFDAKVVDHADNRLTLTNIDGNTYIVLVSYVVNEYNSQAAHDKYEEEFGQGKVPDALQDKELAKYNAVSINNIDAIFPAYLLGLNYENVDWFKKANNYDPATHDFVSGYIIDSSKITQYNNNLLNLLKRSSSEGMKPHAKDLSQYSKDLLAFLPFMFGNGEPTVEVAKFLSTVEWPQE